LINKKQSQSNEYLLLNLENSIDVVDKAFDITLNEVEVFIKDKFQRNNMDDNLNFLKKIYEEFVIFEQIMTTIYERKYKEDDLYRKENKLSIDAQVHEWSLKLIQDK